MVSQIASDDGFVESCLDVHCGTNTGNYYVEMDEKHCHESLPGGDMALSDNTPYFRHYEVVPTRTSNSEAILKLLTPKESNRTLERLRNWSPTLLK